MAKVKVSSRAPDFYYPHIPLSAYLNDSSPDPEPPKPLTGKSVPIPDVDYLNAKTIADSLYD